MKTLIALLVAAATVVHADAPAPVTNLKSALKMAKSQGKLLFVQLGREGCGNCQALKEMISSNRVPVPPSRFIYADVDGDDPATWDLFDSKFKVSGDIYPFVVIAAPDGSMLAGRTGRGSPKDYTDLIREAETKLAKRQRK